MNNTFPYAIFLIVYFAISTGAQSQSVYRCGSTYSQKPCSDAVIVDVGDARSQAQKSQADTETRRESAAANAMEKARLKEEAQLQSDRAKQAKAQSKKTATPPTSAASTAVTAKAGATTNHAKKGHSQAKKEPEYLTARGPAEKPKVSASSAR